MSKTRKSYTPAFKASLVQELLREEQTLNQIASKHGVHPNQLRRWREAAVEAMPDNFTDQDKYQKRLALLSEQHDREKEKLYAQIGKLSTELEWLKKNLRAAVCRTNRLELVERPDGDAKSEVSLVRQAQLLSLARSSLYYQKAAPSAREIELKHQIDRLYTAYPFYGSRRMVAALAQEGVTVNRRTVQHYMREMGLEAIYPGPNLSKRSSSHRVYPYLLRNVIASYPNHVWGILVTYLPLVSGWIYLVAVLDWYSRYVVSWEL